jgi:CubicO group peptidase (beta-lactamase class C family)
MQRAQRCNLRNFGVAQLAPRLRFALAAPLAVALSLPPILPVIAMQQNFRPTPPRTVSPAPTISRRIDRTVSKALAEINMPGYSLTIIQNGRVVYQKGYGYADLETKKLVTPDTIFGIASLTKTMTAALLLSLADERQVDLDATLESYMPQAPKAWRKLTVRQLANMTAGIEPAAKPERSWAKDMQVLAKTPLKWVAGTRYEYSNPSYRLLGTLIEAITGISYFAMLQQRILEPLEMGSTMPMKRFKGSERVATAYQNNDGEIVKVKYKDDAISFSSGMLASSSNDLAKYVAGMLQNKLGLSTEAYQAMFGDRPKLPSGQKPIWAYGWDVYEDKQTGMRFAEMQGGDPGVSSSIVMVPQSGLAVVALSNMYDKRAYKIPPMVARTIIQDQQMLSQNLQ